MTAQQPTEAATAQDVIDALRFALMAQKNPHEVVDLVTELLERAPETDGDRGVRLILEMISEGAMKVAMTDE